MGKENLKKTCNRKGSYSQTFRNPKKDAEQAERMRKVVEKARKEGRINE